MKQTSVEYKVIIQLSSNDILVQKATITQLNNILNAFSNIQIEVTMNGGGIELVLLEGSMANTLEQLHDKGITFLVCQNTLNQKNLDHKSLLPFCKIIPSAIAHIIVRQSESWSYIKAGF